MGKYTTPALLVIEKGAVHTLMSFTKYLCFVKVLRKLD